MSADTVRTPSRTLPTLVRPPNLLHHNIGFLTRLQHVSLVHGIPKSRLKSAISGSGEPRHSEPLPDAKVAALRISRIPGGWQRKAYTQAPTYVAPSACPRAGPQADHGPEPGSTHRLLLASFFHPVQSCLSLLSARNSSVRFALSRGCAGPSIRGWLKALACPFVCRNSKRTPVRSTPTHKSGGLADNTLFLISYRRNPYSQRNVLQGYVKKRHW